MEVKESNLTVLLPKFIFQNLCKGMRGLSLLDFRTWIPRVTSKFGMHNFSISTMADMKSLFTKGIGTMIESTRKVISCYDIMLTLSGCDLTMISSWYHSVRSLWDQIEISHWTHSDLTIVISQCDITVRSLWDHMMSQWYHSDITRCEITVSSLWDFKLISLWSHTVISRMRSLWDHCEIKFLTGICMCGAMYVLVS